jgi:pimeloyl-ACP methyl ester carboxylesterase
MLLWSAWRSRAAGTDARKQLFVEEEIHLDVGKNHLGGTLVKPSTPGPYPAVVFLTDGGASDRTNQGAIPPLARHLAAHGIASLSWDRPGVGASSGDHEMQGIPERAEEAAAALRFLRERAEIQRDRIGLAGIGQGGVVAPFVASQPGPVAFLIAISGCQQVGWEGELYRLEHELRADGFHPTLIAEGMELARLKVELLRHDGAFEEFNETQKALIGRPWFEYMQFCERKRFDGCRLTMTYDPAPTWDQVRCPVLAIYGAKDTVTPVDASLLIIRQGLSTAGNRDVTTKTFSRADHLITVSESGGRKEAADRARRRPPGAGPEFAPGYFDLVTNWLAARSRS